MQLSTVKRESLIPRIHLLSIALLLALAFIVLMPSRETFTYTSASTAGEKNIDDLDLAYLRARDASGDLSDEEMLTIIHDTIRAKRWQQARLLMAQRPEIELEPRDQFLLDLDTASAGFYGARNEGKSVSYKAHLIGLMNDLYDTPVLHDEDTLTYAAEFSADLGQPELSARYYKLMASKDTVKDAEFYYQCARVLERYNLYGQSLDCYQNAIAHSEDHLQRTNLNLRLGNLHIAHGKIDAAKATLETLAQDIPNDQQSLEMVAKFALESGRPDLAHPLYAQLADIDSNRAIFWLEKATKWAEGANHPGIAAEYVLSIRDLSDAKYATDLNRRRQNLLVAAGRNEEALAAMHERIASNPDSGEELLEGVTLATSMGLTQQAMEWNEALLAIRPYDTDALTRQVGFALASQQLPDALVYAKQLLDQDPLDPANRLRVAELEEWNGNVNAAMEQRQWLADNDSSMANDRELLRVAELNWDSITAAKALNRIAKRTTLSAEGLQKLVKLYEQDGSPQLAAAALDDLMDGSAKDAMLLREKAVLHYRHAAYEDALASWEEFANRFGRSAEESLNRMELLWRLKRPTEAVAMTDEITPYNSNVASQYQLSLLTELGWRYRKSTLVIAAAPYIDKDNPQTAQDVISRRIIQSLVDSKDYDQAIKTAENTWRSTDDMSFLLSAIQIALTENVYPHYERYLDANGDLIEVRKIPEYWLTVAEHHNRNGDTQSAIETYRNTLALHPENTDAMSGLIWALLGDDTDDSTLLATLTEFETLAVKVPELWSSYAVGYLRAKDPESSLRWFSKIMTTNDHDYNVLLAFADALEQTGNANHAYKVRQYTLQELLPLAMAETSDNIDAISRDYISLLRSYGSVTENEVWTNRLLQGIEHSSEEESAWRRELAASWYLATQRNDYARLVMTKMHERRLKSPLWQRLAVALVDNNLPEVKEILASSKGQLSPGDEILALRKLGFERQAYVLAENTLENSAKENDRNMAREHMISMRSSRPGYYSGVLTQREMGRLNVTESGLSLRHTLSAADLGFEIDYRRNLLRSGTLDIANNIEDNVAVSAHFGNSERGGRLTAGVQSNGTDELNYTSGAYYIRDRSGKREISSEVSFNEVADTGAEFRIGAKQDKAEVAFQQTLGRREFVRLSGKVNELSTRDTAQRIARGVGASIELGTTGTIGSNSWTMGVVASGSKNDREAQLPISISSLSPLSTFNNVLAEESQELAVSASLFRGGIRSDYPQAASPRYHVSARLGHSWPNEAMGLQLQAGAGFRVMGNDELSLQLEHDRSGIVNTEGDSNSTIGIQYTNHF